MNDDSSMDGDAGTGAEQAARTVVKKKDFYDRVTAKAGGGRAAPRNAVDATLATLAEAISAGEELILPPVGRFKVMKVREGRQGGSHYLVRFLPTNPRVAGGDPLAEADEEG
jgi:hypothetical protein